MQVSLQIQNAKAFSIIVRVGAFWGVFGFISDMWVLRNQSQPSNIAHTTLSLYRLGVFQPVSGPAALSSQPQHHVW